MVLFICTYFVGHHIKVEKSALACERGGGCTPTSFQPVTITYKVVEYAPEFKDGLKNAQSNFKEEFLLSLDKKYFGKLFITFISVPYEHDPTFMSTLSIRVRS